MRPVTEQVILVTGATDGLGAGVVHDLARRGATVLVHGRSEERLAASARAAREAGARAVRSYRADLSSLAEVRALARDVLAAEPRLDALVQNAGIGTRVPGGGARMVSADGIELRFAVNYLADYLLTRELLPLLRRSAPSRVVHVSSIGQAALDFDDPFLERAYDGTRAYGQSKLAQVLFTVDLAEELRGTGVTTNALHPATYMPTKIVASPISPLAQGVDATVRLVIDPELEGVSGRFFDGKREARAHEQAYDARARAKLRALSERLTAS